MEAGALHLGLGSWPSCSAQRLLRQGTAYPGSWPGSAPAPGSLPAEQLPNFCLTLWPICQNPEVTPIPPC